jgi:hypothetical protein
VSASEKRKNNLGKKKGREKAVKKSEKNVVLTALVALPV